MVYDCLIVDDEKELGAATCEYFDMFGLMTKHVTNSEACIKTLQENQVKVVLLDINLEQESGFTLCKRIREFSNLPILFISARQTDDDIIIALNIGGDDYIKKPYSLSVLLAKVKVILKRLEEQKSMNPIKREGLELDVNAMKAYLDGEEIKLKTKEFKLLAYLYENANRVIPKSELFAKVWGDEFFSDGTLNVHIRKIREKIEKDPNNPTYIKTIWGTGYIMER